MARGAFAANTLRAWRADWESRGVTVGDLRDVVTTPCNGDERPKDGPERSEGVRCGTQNNPSLGRTHAFDGWARTTTLGLRVVRTAQRNAAGNTWNVRRMGSNDVLYI